MSFYKLLLSVLPDNEFGDEGVASLCAGLRQSSRMTAVKLDLNNIQTTPKCKSMRGSCRLSNYSMLSSAILVVRQILC